MKDETSLLFILHPSYFILYGLLPLILWQNDELAVLDHDEREFARNESEVISRAERVQSVSRYKVYGLGFDGVTNFGALVGERAAIRERLQPVDRPLQRVIGMTGECTDCRAIGCGGIVLDQF